MSMLSAFTTQLVRFFDELSNTIPEEKDIKMAKDAIKMTQAINPRLLLELFYEHIYTELHTAIMQSDLEAIKEYAKRKLETQFNEILPAISIFNKHWTTLSPASQDAIWKYLKVLCLLCEKARASSTS